jgi:hypothetical protein
MRKRGIAVLAPAALLLLAAACGGRAPEAAASKPAAADPKVDALLRSFASAIVARDYASAYGAVAAERRASLSQQEFEEAFRHYRDELPDALETEIGQEPFDRESAVLVPDEYKDRVVAEGSISFEPGGEAEGFSATLWILLEAGEPKLASFYVED